MPRITPEQAGGKNICAFLDMIAHSEIGEGLLSITDDGYNVLVGSTPQSPLLFGSYSDHPHIHNEKLNSDAAGRYQVMGRYWPFYKKLLALPDFGPLSQDLYAIRQISESHALPLITAGHFADAVEKCAHIWASLPGAGYGQHENKLAVLQRSYVDAGGVVA